jgi:ribosomal protein L37E
MNENATEMQPPETTVQVTLICSECGSRSVYDGNGGEFCAECGTGEHLVRREYIYRLVDIEPI